MKTLTSSSTQVWTEPTPTTPTTPARALVKRCGRAVCHHPGDKGGLVVLGVLSPAESPWDRLACLLTRIPNPWPVDGWILTMELACPFCGETRLIEQQQSHRGQILVCSMCGKTAPLVPAGGGRG